MAGNIKWFLEKQGWMLRSILSGSRFGVLERSFEYDDNFVFNTILGKS
jgi:hypothetical protein